MSGNIMLGDLTGAVLATLLFFPLLVLPGWLAGWATGAVGFRQVSLPLKLLLSTVFGVSVVPISVYLLARFGGFGAVWLGYGVVGLAFLGVATKGLGEQPLATLGRALGQGWVLVALILWIGGGYVMMADWEVSGRLAQHGMTLDKANHVAVIDAITRTGVPPANPYLHPGEPLALFYYYFWFLVGSVVDRLGGDVVGARAAGQAGTLWAGLALMAGMLLWVRHLSRLREGGPCYGLALFLLLVTGLDLLPLLAYGLIFAQTGQGPGFPANPEWWNEQVTAWPAAMLWVPHHIAGFVACLTGFLALRNLPERPVTWRETGPLILAGAAFASAVGLSVWVTLVAAAGTLVWLLYATLRRMEGETLRHLVAGGVALVFVLPFLIDLTAAQRLTGPPVEFWVRDFWPVTRFDDWFGIDVACGAGCRLALLPLNYALELGFLLFAVPFFWRREWALARRERDAGFLMTLALTALVLCSVLRSAVSANDLGWRGFMFVQFALIWWALPVARKLLPGRSRVQERGLGRAGRTTLITLLIIGLLGTGAQILRLRILPATEEALALRQTYAWINTHTPRDSVLQHNPDRRFEPFHALFAHRQTGVADRLNGALFGIDPPTFEGVFDPVSVVFQKGVGALQAAKVCRRFGIDLLVVRSDDPIWNDPDGWARRTEPVFETPYSRVVEVGALQRRP